MASSKPFYTDNMTVSEILALGDDILSKLDQREMSRAVRTAALAANKRINRLLENAVKRKDGYINKKSGKQIALDALNYITADGKLSPKFTAKQQTRNDLFHELARIRAFMDLETSTIKGATAVRKMRETNALGMTQEQYINQEIKKIKKATGKKPSKKDIALLTGKSRSIFADKISKAYENFRKFNEMQGISNSPYRKYHGSDEILMQIGQMTLAGDDDDDILTKVSEKFELRYIEQIEETQKAIENSDPFNLITKSNNDFGYEI